MLDTQYRMHPKIGELINGLYYGGKLRHGECTAERQAIADRPPAPGEPLVVVDTHGRDASAVRSAESSRHNETTEALSVEMALEAAAAGADSIAIITPYAEQARRIRKRLAGAGPGAKAIECRTVHRFQGGERDVVIFDTVDTEPLRPGVLLSDRREGAQARNLINVSLSRARGKLVIVADVRYFKKRAPESPIAEVLRRAIETGARVQAG